MTALSFDAPLQFLGPVFSEKLKISSAIYPVTIWRGAPVIIDISEDDTAVTQMDGVTMGTGDVFVGIAAEHAVSVVGQAEPTELEVYVWPTIVGFASTAVDMSDLGKSISMSDTGTLTASGGAYPIIGTLYSVRDDGYVYVLLSPPSLHS
jgi:hypothetical protein